MNVCAAPDGHDPHRRDQLVRSERVPLRADEELAAAAPSARPARDATSTDALLDEQRRQRVARRRGRAEVAAERAAVADLRRADRARRLGERRQELAPAAPPSPRRTSGPTPSRSVPFSRDQPRSSGTSFRFRSTSGRRRSKFSSTITSVPPWIGTALRVLGLHAQRLVERVRRRRPPSAFLAHVRYAERGGRAEPAPREAGRDEHEHDDRHHVRQRVQELGRDRRTRAPGAPRAARRTARRRGRRRRGRAPAARTRRSRARSRSSRRRRRASRRPSSPG